MVEHLIETKAGPIETPMAELTERIAGLSPAKRALLELRLQKREATRSPTHSITPRTNRDWAAVSFAQQRLWFLDRLEPDRVSYNVPRAIRLTGLLNIQALERTLNELIARHEPFRTRFSSVDGTLRQIISAAEQLPLRLIDLGNLANDEKENRARELMKEEAGLPFDLAHGPVIRSSLLRLGEREHILLLTTHHIVSDAWSTGILFRELGALYNAFAGGKDSPLLPLPIQYADFAEWQREWLQGDVLEEQLGYWRQQLGGATGILELPADYPRPAVLTARGAHRSLSLSRALSEQVAELSKRQGATLFMTLLAAFQTLLYRYTDEEDIVVGSPIAGRNRGETEELIGFFINTLALRTNLAGDPTFRELLSRVKETAVGAYAHQDLPFEKLVEELQPERDLNRTPFFQTMFQFQNASGTPLELNGLAIKQLDVATETSKFDLMLAALEEAGVLTLVMEYSADLFAGETIDRLLRQFSTLLEGAVDNPAERISRLPLMTEAERRLVLSDWNTTQAEFPRERCIHQLFEDQAERVPDDVAVVSGSGRVTFAELNARANQLAHHLQRLGVVPETRVAICLERSAELIVGLLGVLKAGGAYVPLEPSFPAERLSFILADSQAQLLLTQEHLLASLPGSTARVVTLDGDAQEIAQEDKENPTSTVTSENAAHVIYTSGSTGRPKGVVSAHRASVNRFAWMWREYPFMSNEVCCQKTSLSFVDSIWEIFGPLLKGVPLVIIPEMLVKDPKRFVQSLEDSKVTRLVLVPSLLRVILESSASLSQRLASLRYCVCSGETLAVDLATEFRKQLPAAKLINLYGSSEVAADVTGYEVGSAERPGSVPIGRPLANTHAYVLDPHLQPTPICVPGEIFIGGEGLARGYLNRPGMTAESFIPHPFAASAGARLFRTGDLGRYLADGNIEYRGRRDHQVKIRGFRIELGEIETVLATHARVRQAVAVTLDNEGEKRLAAYVVADGEQPTAGELRLHLREKLPDYMIPTVFVMLDSLPLTASGKVNRLALPKPEASQFAATEDFQAPRTPAEDLLAGIWAEALNCDTVGINDDFFSLGGHSLLLVRIASRIHDVFALELPLRALFEAPTVAGMAEKIEAARRAGDGSTEFPIVAVTREGSLPLSFAQERLWFFDQLEPGSAAYNIPRVFRLRGALDLAALQSSLNDVVARHEVLRSRFLTNQGQPALSIAGSETMEIPLFDLRQPATESEQRARELIKAETGRPFDLTRGPLLRLALARLNEDDHLLLLTMHHIVSDGWSIGILLRELVSLYNALVRGNKPALPELPVQYVDFVAWQRKRSEAGADNGPLQKQLEFWRRQLEGAPALIDLPTDRPRPPVRSFRGAKQPVTISKETTDGLKKLARAERATMFMALLNAFQLLLSSLNGQEDIVVGSPTAGRNRRETEVLIGYFVNTIVLRAKLSDDPSFRKALARVREVALGAYANQDVSFEQIVEELQPGRTLSHNPLFQVWLVLQNAPSNHSEWHGLDVKSIEVESATTRHDLQLTLWETADGMEGAFTYSTDLFEAETIACFVEQFRHLLEMVVQDPDVRLSVLRARLAELNQEHRQSLAQRLEEASHQKLRAVKRRSYGTGSGSDLVNS